MYALKMEKKYLKKGLDPKLLIYFYFTRMDIYFQDKQIILTMWENINREVVIYDQII